MTCAHYAQKHAFNTHGYMDIPMQQSHMDKLTHMDHK